MSNYKRKDFYLLCISSLEEKEELHEFCRNKNVPITYPELFTDKAIYHLWVINSDGVGLCGTAVANSIQKENILHSVKELKEKEVI